MQSLQKITQINACMHACMQAYLQLRHQTTEQALLLGQQILVQTCAIAELRMTAPVFIKSIQGYCRYPRFTPDARRASC